MRLKKLLAFVLSLLMVLSLLPVGATAAGGDYLTKNSGECPMGGTHQWRGWYAPAPTCTESGTIVWVCDKCEMDDETTAPALGHDWGPWETMYEPTCTNEGAQVRSCNRCGERQKGVIPALGHAWKDEVISQKDPTCTDDGYKEYRRVCSRCGEDGGTHKDTIPALGHDWGSWKTTKEPVCEHTGKKEHTCKRCGLKEEKKINAIGHLWDEGVITKTPTPEAPGEITYTCQRDPSHTYTQELPYNGDPVTPGPPDPGPDPDPDPVPDDKEVLLTLSVVQISPVKAEYEEGDPIWTEMTLTNDSDESVEIPAVKEFWVENWSNVMTYTETIVLAPGESYKPVAHDSIIGTDVENGHVTFEFSGTANKVSDGSPVYSNKVTMTWQTKDSEPEPIPEDQYSLALNVSFANPKSEYVVDGMGDTEEIPYYVTVTNTGNLPVIFSTLTITINGIDSVHTEPTQFLMPGDPYSFYLYGTILNESQITPGTGTASTLGIVSVLFTAAADHPDSGAKICDSNTVPLDHTLVEPGPWTPDFSSFSVDKVEISAPSVSPYGYVEGETISYDIYITNTGSLTIATGDIHDSTFEYMGSDVLNHISNMDPWDTVVCNYTYVVTADDVDTGYVENIAYLTWTDPFTGMEMKAESLPVISPTVKNEPKGGLVIVKSVIGDPDNSAYYIPGEKITFHVAVTNTMDETISDIWIYDAFSDPVYIATLGAHDTFEWSYDYEATDYDAGVGFVSNIAFGGGFASDGYKAAASDEVSVPVHFPDSKTAALKLTKEADNKPANGSYFELGEEILYKITVENIGEAVLYDICLYDSLDFPPVEFAHIGILNPGESKTEYYHHTVTQDDVDQGYIENWAIADYWPEGDYTWYSTYAGPVYSPTGEHPIIKKNPPFTGPAKDDSCELVLTGVGTYTLTEEQHFCGVHKACEDQVDELLANARTEADTVAAWKQGVEIWRAALEAEYTEILEDSDGAIRLSVMEDKAIFDKYIESLETMLNAIHPDNPGLVAKTVCNALMRQCTELCYLHRNPGKARKDSMVTGPFKAIEGDTAAAECTSETSPVRGGLMQVVHLDEDHGKIQNTVIYLVKAIVNRNSAEDTFKRVRRLWQSNLDQATNVRYRAATGDARNAVAQNRMLFDQLIEKQTEMLNLIYPANPEIVMEIISNMMRDQVFILCEVW